jgi:glycosyltransferase involved in cell wall biosynthesis
MVGPALNVIQSTAWYPPFHLGGTEVYLEGLIHGLSDLGVKSIVVMPRSSGAIENYVHAGIPIETYPVSEARGPGAIRSRGPLRGFATFKGQLSKYRESIYHQHTWIPDCGLAHLRAAHEQGLRTVFTMHVPGPVCLRGTMLRFGSNPCDGHIQEVSCGACWANGRGLPKMFAQAIGNLPLGLAERARRGETRLATALSARALGAEKLSRLREMFENSDRIVAVCQWLYDALAANGVPLRKLVLNRQGISDRFALERGRSVAKSTHNASLNLLYLGRWSPLKGIDVVVRAIRRLPPHLGVHLTIHAIPGGNPELVYEEKVRAIAAGDPRISIEGPVSRDLVSSVISQYDALVVPSVWMETGPLVVLEAQAAGLFVLGSRLGGIAELVDEHDGGELVEAGNVAAWSKAIEGLVRKYADGALLRPERPVRTMSEVAVEMADLYRSL